MNSPYLAIREIHRRGGKHTEEEILGRNRCCVYMEWNNIWWTAVLAPTTQKTLDKFKPRQVLNWFKKLQRPITGQDAENRRLQTALNETSISYLLFLKDHFRWDRKILRARCGQCFPDIAGNLYIWTHRYCDSLHKTCAGSSQTKPQQGRGWYKGPPLDEELLAIDSCSERHSLFSLRVESQVGLPRSSWWSNNQEYMGSTNWTLWV